MVIYIIETKTWLAPFLSKAKHCKVGNVSLDENIKKLAEKLKARIIRIKKINDIKLNNGEKALVVYDDIFITYELLKKFIKLAKKKNKNCQLAISCSLFTKRMMENIQGIKKDKNFLFYDVYFLVNRELVFQKIGVDIDYKKEKLKFPLHMIRDGCYIIPITDQIIAKIDHWSVLWAVNVLFSLKDIYSLQTSFFQKIKGVWRAMSFNQWKIIQKNNQIGKNVDIHPTAYVEGSIVGDNVTIGAGSVIRFSNIGDNVTIGTSVSIESSVIGSRSTILQGHILYSVFLEEVFSFTQSISASIIGQESFLGSGSVLTDFRFDEKTVSVLKNRKLMDTQNIFLGCCLSNKTYLGAGCIVAPGRCLSGKIVFPFLIKK